MITSVIMSGTTCVKPVMIIHDHECYATFKFESFCSFTKSIKAHYHDDNLIYSLVIAAGCAHCSPWFRLPSRVKTVPTTWRCLAILPSALFPTSNIGGAYAMAGWNSHIPMSTARGSVWRLTSSTGYSPHLSLPALSPESDRRIGARESLLSAPGYPAFHCKCVAFTATPSSSSQSDAQQYPLKLNLARFSSVLQASGSH